MEKGILGTKIVTQIGFVVNDIEKTSQAFADFLREAAASYDYVLCTLPFEDKLPDADCAARAADSVVLVAEYGMTPYRDFEESLTRLRTAGGKVSGFILEGVR